MAWTAPVTWTANTTLTAALLNTHLRDNMLALEPALATTVGSYFCTTSANTIAERVPDFDFVATSQTTASTAYVDLATVGPSVTLNTSNTALVITRCRMEHSVDNNHSLSSFAISGATTQAGNDSRAILMDGHAAGNFSQMAQVDLVSDLVSGSNTFTAKYRTAGATATFSNRFLAVIPF